MTWQNRIIRSENVDPTSLTPNPKNWRKHPKFQAEAMNGVLDDVGWIQDVIVNERTGNLIDGHLRLELARKNKESTIPVKYVDLTVEEEEKALAIFDPIGAMAEADATMLNALIERCQTDNEEVKGLLVDIAEKEKLDFGKKEAKEDDFEPPIEVETTIKRGDIIQLGRHRLMCGDSTSADDVGRLMDGKKADICFTSPPYNAGSLNIKGDPSTAPKYIDNCDDRTEGQYVKFLDDVLSNALAFADTVMVNIGLVETNKRAIVRLLGLYIENFKDIIYWKKATCAPHIQPGIINNLVEFILCFGDGKRAFKSAQFGQGTYWNVIEGANASGNEYAKIHKATFPIYLPANIIGNFCPPWGNVFDPFLGSGTTLIACEQLNRICYGMEISPQYCEVICMRWEKLTGGTRVMA